MLDSEDPPREAPEGIRESLELYNRLQVEDPERAQAMLAEFMADEAVIAGLSTPVEFDAEQLTFIEDALAKNSGVRWTFLFLHEPAWENPSDSFKAIQAMLEDRRHTFFAGHLHYYDYDLIDGHEYITMGPSGASFHHDGPGNVDHVTWVTMTEDGPQIATEQTEIRVDDCVFIEEAGGSTNIRRAPATACAPESADLLNEPAMIEEMQEEAAECAAAKQELIDADSDAATDRAFRKVQLLCYD